MPDWAEGPPPPFSVVPGGLADLVVEADLPDGIRARAFRDGMLAFNMGEWGDRPSGGIEDFEAAAEYQMRCVRLMNAHLACLQTVAQRPHRLSVLIPEQVMRVRFADGRFDSGSGSDHYGFDLWRIRSERVSGVDWRVHRPFGPVTAEGMTASFELLADLLRRPRQALVLLRAELLYRAASAYQDHDHSSSLVNAWVVAEGLVGDALAAYIEDCDKQVDGDEVFLNAERRGFLQGPQITSRIAAEILSLADRVSFELYCGLRMGAKARNDWLHKQKKVSAEDAGRAVNTATELFELVEGIQLRMPLGRGLGLL